MGIFLALDKQGPLTSDALAKHCNAELLFTQRLLRCLVAHDVLRIGQQGYELTTSSRAFAQPGGVAAIHIEKAGLKVTGIWDPQDGVSESIIECEVA